MREGRFTLDPLKTICSSMMNKVSVLLLSYCFTLLKYLIFFIEVRGETKLLSKNIM